MLANESLIQLKEYPTQESSSIGRSSHCSDNDVVTLYEEDKPIQKEKEQKVKVMEPKPCTPVSATVQVVAEVVSQALSLESLIKQTPQIEKSSDKQTPCLGYRMLPTSLHKSTPIQSFRRPPTPVSKKTKIVKSKKRAQKIHDKENFVKVKNSKE